ncbi:Thioredoxin-dependent 5'-adenylylsulfate reductase [termite gut metagenome]|uniref:Adenosine 5'-phosphosulfate reductase n=1 Tax=termite gut metagenome TaxID=433724 RepID=A0A5J4RLU2_9ZZZZ
MKADIEQLNRQFSGNLPQKLLTFFLNEYKNRIALASSLGPEDQVLTDMIVKIDRSATIFTIDTGRLFPETYSLIDKTNLKYNIKVDVYSPKHEPVEAYVKQNGINGFYESIDKRKQCCRVRKIEPLLRALSTLDVWICGLRREQSVTRTGVQAVEWDEANRLIKVNPLVHWSEQNVWEYIKANHVPYNVLHKENFPSIGCQPCTRAVAEGEDIRAGRWWWENPEHKECGLHRR